MTRLALVGPLPPFRSGIAQHTMMLARALAVVTDLHVFSFTRQYPAWLFPGETDKDASPPPDGVGHREYVLDSLNPWTWRRTADAIVACNPDAVVVAWWTVYWAACFSYLARRLRARGIPVLFMCHNVVDHDSSWVTRTLSRHALGAGSGFIVQSDGERDRLLALLRSARVAVHPHPVYDQYPAADEEPARRARLELLFFGIVRPYKGLDTLLGALAQVAREQGEHGIFLTIAGEFWHGRAETQRLVRELGLSQCVEIIPRYVSDTEAARLFARADAVVLPYVSASGSGVLSLALHYARPVIASRVAGLAEHIAEGSTGFLFSAGSVDELAGILSGLDPSRLAEMRTGVARLSTRYSWASLAQTVVEQVGGHKS